MKNKTSFIEKKEALSIGTALPSVKISWTGPVASSLSIIRSTEIINIIADIKILFLPIFNFGVIAGISWISSFGEIYSVLNKYAIVLFDSIY